MTETTVEVDGEEVRVSKTEDGFEAEAVPEPPEDLEEAADRVFGSMGSRHYEIVQNDPEDEGDWEWALVLQNSRWSMTTQNVALEDLSDLEEPREGVSYVVTIDPKKDDLTEDHSPALVDAVDEDGPAAIGFLYR